MLVCGELGGAVIPAVEFHQISLVESIIQPGKDAGAFPSALIGVFRKVVSHGHIDGFHIFGNKAVTKHIKSLGGRLFPVVTHKGLEVVLIGEDFCVFGIGVNRNIISPVPCFLYEIVHARGSNPTDFSRSLAVRHHGILLQIVFPHCLIGEIRVQTKAVVEEFRPGTGCGGEIVAKFVGIVLSRNKTADSHGTALGEGAVRIEYRNTHMAFILDTAKEEAAVVLVVAGRDMVLVVVE